MVTKTLARKPLRDADAMRGRIIEAVGRIILRDGLQAMGVNALAREAGCDKVLIYRYFGNLEGVYEAFAGRSDFWWTVDELVSGIDPKAAPMVEAAKTILKRSLLAIRSRPVTLAVLAAEPVERTPLVVALEGLREKRSLELLKWLGAHYRVPEGIDFPAVAILLASGATYLAIRARKIRVMSGVPIKTDKDWERLFATMDMMVERIFAGM